MLSPAHRAVQGGGVLLFVIAFGLFLRWLPKRARRWFIEAIEDRLRTLGAGLVAPLSAPPDVAEAAAIWRTVKESAERRTG